MHAPGAAGAAPLVFPLGARLNHFFLGAGTLHRVLQPLDHLVCSAFGYPTGETCHKTIRCAREGVDTGADVQAARAGSFDSAENFRHFAPILAICGLQMPDRGRNISLLRDGEYFLQRLEDLIALGPLMRKVNAAVSVGDLR